MSTRRRGLTLTCRFICSALVAAPLLYVCFVADGDAYHFLLLVLLAPVAALVLVAHSAYGLLHCRTLTEEGLREVHDDGGMHGVSTVLFMVPEENLALAVLSNTHSRWPEAMLMELLHILLPGKVPALEHRAVPETPFCTRPRACQPMERICAYLQGKDPPCAADR